MSRSLQEDPHRHLRRWTKQLAIALAVALVVMPTAATAKKKKKKLQENEAEVVGKVVNQAEETLAGIRVTVTSPADPELRFEAVTDAEGIFTLRVANPVGSYAFHLEGDGYASFDGQIPLQAGERAEIAFQLLDAATGRAQEAIKAFNAGVRAFDQKDYPTARAKFEEAAKLNPDAPEPHLGLAEVYYREEKLAAAAASIDRYLASRSDDTSGLTLAYTIHRELGNVARAEELVDALARTDKAPALATQVYNEGVRALQTGQNDLAVAKLERASELDPNLTAPYSTLATIYYNEARFGQAHAALEKLFAIEPENTQGRRIRYLIYDALDDSAQAEKALAEYMEADPDGAVDVLYRRADMDFRAGETAKAIAALRKILALRPEHPRAHYTLGLCYASSDTAKARFHLEKFIELAPEDPEAASAKEMLGYL